MGYEPKMKKNQLSLLLLPLLLTSCIVGTVPEKSIFESVRSSEALVSSSYDFGSDPTSVYQRENGRNITVSFPDGEYRVTELRPNGDRGLLGPYIDVHFGDSWVDVELVGQEDITAGVKGLNTFTISHAYNDWSNDILLDGREFPGLGGESRLCAYIPGKACRNPDEAFIRFISHPKDNLDAINGYALAVVHPIGDPVDAASEEASLYHREDEVIRSGPVWLDWKAEAVRDGVSFPKVNGEYQDIDINRVNAALDIMCENAKGHYFNKAS
jgi:hypothetical protein